MIELSIKIKDIAESGEPLVVPFSRALLKDALDGMDAELTRSHVTANMQLSRVGETVSVRGALDGDVQLACTRCLGEAHVPIHIPLRITIGAEAVGGEDSLDDEVEYFTHDGVRIELENVLREALILAVPMTAICKEDCKGLCASCGADRNVTDCGHSQALPDPRLSVLKDLKI